jgi:hypothetical protein
MKITLLQLWVVLSAIALLKEVLFFKSGGLNILAKNDLLFRFSFKVC